MDKKIETQRQLEKQQRFHETILKHWYRVFYILICLAGLITFLTLIAAKPAGATTGTLVCLLLAPLAYFMGTIMYNVFKMIKKTEEAANWVQLFTGAITIALFGVGADAVYNGSYGLVTELNSAASGNSMAMWHAGIVISFTYIWSLLVIGLMPFVKGISKTLISVEGGNLHHLARPEPEPATPVKKPRKPRTPRPKPAVELADEPEPTPDPIDKE